MKVNNLSLFIQMCRRLSNSRFRQQFLTELKTLPSVRNAATLARFYQFRNSSPKSNRNVFTYTDNNEGLIEVTIEHNSDASWMFFTEMSSRPDAISRVLSSTSTVRLNAHKMQMLIVGGRTEAEIMSMMNAGFSESNIKSIDLFSYSPLIEIGTVIDLPYESGTFDVVVVGWVLEFVSDIPMAISEINRVAKDGGIIAIGAMYHPHSMNLEDYLKRNRQEDRVWMPQSVKEILDAFGATPSEVIFSSDVLEEDADKRTDLIAIFHNQGAINEV